MAFDGNLVPLFDLHQGPTPETECISLTHIQRCLRRLRKADVTVDELLETARDSNVEAVLGRALVESNPEPGVIIEETLKLNGVIQETPTLHELFTHTRNDCNFYTFLNTGATVIIDLSGFSPQATEMLATFFMNRLMNVVQLSYESTEISDGSVIPDQSPSTVVAPELPGERYRDRFRAVQEKADTPLITGYGLCSADVDIHQTRGSELVMRSTPDSPTHWKIAEDGLSNTKESGITYSLPDIEASETPEIEMQPAAFSTEMETDYLQTLRERSDGIALMPCSQNLIS
jgi:hypothetical protein